MGQFVEVLKQAKALVACIDAGSHNPPTVAWARQVEADLFELIEQIEKAEPDSIAVALHYPECWDTAAYPTVYDALVEVSAAFRCSNDDCAHPAQQEAEKAHKYGCHCDLGPDEQPDYCWIDRGRPDNCCLAVTLIADGKGRDDCAEWRLIEVTTAAPKEQQ